eukprot:1194440-Prorocentrum_minimum.AAC.6
MGNATSAANVTQKATPLLQKLERLKTKHKEQSEWVRGPLIPLTLGSPSYSMGGFFPVFFATHRTIRRNLGYPPLLMSQSNQHWHAPLMRTVLRDFFVMLWRKFSYCFYCVRLEGSTSG